MQNNATNQQCNKCCTIIREGFTIIELIIVVLIIAVVGGAVIGRMLNGIERTRLQAAGRQVVSHIRLAQERSKLEQRAYTVEFNATNETYAVYQAASSFSSGTNAYVDCGNGDLLNITGSFTIEAWVKSESDDSAGYLVSKYDGLGGYEINLRADGGMDLKLDGVTDGLYSSTTPDVTDMNWHHVVFIYNNSTPVGYMYIDNVYKNFLGWVGGDIPSSLSTNTNNLCIGRESDGTNYFKGVINEIRIYNRVLSAGEIDYSYTYRTPQSRAGLVAWWKLDEGAGTSATDYSGNSNTGTITNGTWTQGAISYVKDPAKNYQDINYDFDNMPEFSGVKISTVDFDGSTITNSSSVRFDSLGRPQVGNENLSADGTVVLTCGDQTLTITVIKSTGEVKMQ